MMSNYFCPQNENLLLTDSDLFNTLLEKTATIYNGANNTANII